MEITFNLKAVFFSNHVVQRLTYLEVLEKNYMYAYITYMHIYIYIRLIYRLSSQALSLNKLLVTQSMWYSFGEFIQLLIQTSLLAKLNVSFELFHYLGEMAFTDRAWTQPCFPQQHRPHCHFLLSLSVCFTEKNAEAEELKLVTNHKSTSKDWRPTRASLSCSFSWKLKHTNKMGV